MIELLACKDPFNLPACKMLVNLLPLFAGVWSFHGAAKKVEMILATLPCCYTLIWDIAHPEALYTTYTSDGVTVLSPCTVVGG